MISKNPYWIRIINHWIYTINFVPKVHINFDWKVIYDVSDIINGEKTRHGMNDQSNIIDDYSIYAAIPTNTCLPSFKVRIKMPFRVHFL